MINAVLTYTPSPSPSLTLVAVAIASNSNVAAFDNRASGLFNDAFSITSKHEPKRGSLLTNKVTVPPRPTAATSMARLGTGFPC